MRKIICDRCYEEITENPVKICMEEVDRKTGDFAEYHLHEDLADIDLCKKCADCLAEKIRMFSKKKKPVLINRDFEDAIQEMIATSQPDEGNPPPRGQAQTQTGRRENTGPQECGVDGESNRRRNELFGAGHIQCTEEAGQKESP